MSLQSSPFGSVVFIQLFYFYRFRANNDAKFREAVAYIKG